MAHELLDSCFSRSLHMGWTPSDPGTQLSHWFSGFKNRLDSLQKNADCQASPPHILVGQSGMGLRDLCFTKPYPNSYKGPSRTWGVDSPPRSPGDLPTKSFLPPAPRSPVTDLLSTPQSAG